MSNIFRKILIYTFFLSLVSIPLFSFSLYMPDDPQVKELVFLYTRAGLVFPDASFPLSLADLNSYASRLQNHTENRKIRDQIIIYKESLNFKKGRVVTNNSYKLKTAAFINGDTYIPETDIDLEHTRYPNDFANRFVEFPDMGYFGLSAGVQGESGIYIAAGLKREYHPETVVDTNLFISTSSDPAKFENYFVRKGYLAWKTGNFEFRFGRTPVHYGDASFSTFLPSDKLPWLDTFTYRYEVGPLTMTSYFGTIDSRITDDEQFLFSSGSLISEDGSSVTFGDDPNADSFRENVLLVDEAATEFAFQETLILTSMHRFVLGWEKLRLGFTSSIIVARENNAIQIGDIFPVFSWHNAVLGSNNMNLVFDAGYVPLPGLALYGQAAWDDINASDLIGIPDGAVPTIGAYLFGVSYIPGWMSKQNLSMKMEIGTTHYLWGNYYAYHDWKGSYLSRAIYRYHTQQGEYWMPLTSPYGPGTWWIEGESDISLNDSINFTAGFTYLKFNADVNLFTTAYTYDPSLEVFNSSSFSVYFESGYTYKLSDNSNLEFKLIPVWYSYKGHGWPELEISFGLSGKKIKDF
ncbi:MAG: hypothetical protein PF693_09275 [Spirochaetia bacterium]|nr:hypothetical protein [Spirochaetia bacterium]